MTQHTYTIETTYKDAIDRMTGMCYNIACHEDTNYADAPLISEIVRNTTVQRKQPTMTHNTHYCPECGLPVRESKAFVEKRILDVSKCSECGGRLTSLIYVSEEDITNHLIRIDNATLMVYDNPGLTISAMNLYNIERMIFTIDHQRKYVACETINMIINEA